MFYSHAIKDNQKMIRQIEPETVVSLRQLSSMFMRHFQGARKYVTPLGCLANIKQGLGKMLKSYIKRFNDKLTTPRGMGWWWQ